MPGYRKPITKSATIANGATSTGEIELRDYVLVGLVTPATFTGTAITITVSDTKGGTYVPLYDSDGNQISIAVAVSRGQGLSGSEADALAPWAWMKLVSNAAEGGARTLLLTLK